MDQGDKPDPQKSHPAYLEALPRYMTAMDPAFARARDRSEFEFLLCLLRVRGVQDAGWDPYETTLRAVPAICAAHEQVTDYEAQRHLDLWVYGHILEASEPYEILANLLAVARGDRFKLERFPVRRGGRPLSPETKIRILAKAAAAEGVPQIVTPLTESWDRTLRNAVFHADYSLHGADLRTLRPMRKYTHDETMLLINRALAYHNALAALYESHVRSYTEPVVIPVHPDFSADPDERCLVIVRQGHGAVGLKDAWTLEQRRAGKIPFRLGRFAPEEVKLLDADPALGSLPARQRESSGGLG